MVSTNFIAVVTMYSANLGRWVIPCVENKSGYSAVNGYEFIFASDLCDASRPPAWNKFLFIKRHLPDHNWVFWTDADVLFIDGQRRLDDFIDPDYDVIISEGDCGLNPGNFFVRNTAAGNTFLIRGMTAAMTKTEKEAIKSAAEQTTNLRLKIVPQRLFDARPNDYEVGDFLCHFSGTFKSEIANWMKRPRVMQDYAGRYFDAQE